MPRKLYEESDKSRIFSELGYRPALPYRSEYRRDLDRLIHSTCFRRLQGKTQLYPGLESDFFRNRLTHSLEVAQIAKSIAAKVNDEYKEVLNGEEICPEIVELAGLAHDLGHPPFGHQGEEMLNYLMRDHGGYEGNAQTLRILRRIEKKGYGDAKLPFDNGEDQRIGLNFTARTLASILKYEVPINETQPLPPSPKTLHAPKGFYSMDKDTVEWIKRECGGSKTGEKFKTVECLIMDVADDIAYSTYDLEDGLKAGFYTLMDVVFCSERLRDAIAAEVKIKYDKKPEYALAPLEVSTILQDLFRPILQYDAIEPKEGTPTQQHYSVVNSYYELMLEFSKDGYARNYLTSALVHTFIEGIEFIYDAEYPVQSIVRLKEETLKKVEVLKKFTFTSQVLSSRLKIAEVRGKDIVNEIFQTLVDPDKKGFELLPDDYRQLYDSCDESNKKRMICDFIAGMTDRYAIEFYGRLKSENPETIFKPL